MSDEIYFDASSVAIDFAVVESMTLTKCTRSGRPEPFRLLQFQRKLIGNLLGWRRADGSRLYRRAFFSTARKNSKSQCAAALALLLLLDPEEMSPEVYIASKSRDQSAYLFQAAADMVTNHEELRDLLTVIPYAKEIKNPQNSGLLKALSAEGKTKHGSNPSAVIIDEFHVWGSAETELYDALTTGSAARRQPLTVILTTAGIGRETLCRKEYDYARRVLDRTVQDESYLPMIYELPEAADWKDESFWHFANPGLHEIIPLEYLREEFRKAAAMPSEQQKFKRLYLNMWTDQTNTWIPLSAWDACKQDFDIRDLREYPCYGGLDLGSTRDLTCFTLTWPVETKFYVAAWFWLPDHNLKERCARDGVRYDLWAEQGYVTLTPGRDTDWSYARQHILKLAEEFTITDIGADPYGARDTAHELEKAELIVTAVGQKHPDLDAPTRRFEELVTSGDLIHDGNPVLKWNLANCALSSDAEGRIKPVKLEKISAKRIDGVVAVVMGLDRIMRRKPPEDECTSIYEDGRGIKSL
jgi:phage terminase large subunit-like protein